MSGWRTVVINCESELCYSENNLIIRTDKEAYIPIEQINTLYLNTTRISITAKLISELAENDVKIIFCNDCHCPSCAVEGLGNHTETAGRIMDQARWSEDLKEKVWKNIIKEKIHTQSNLLKCCNIPTYLKLLNYEEEVNDGDRTNCEAVSAKLYFASLFGNDFIRHSPDSINSALDYGYAILLSAASRIITAYGYSSALGINHCSRNNPFNLSCDIMEPFRPFIDFKVMSNIGRTLDWEYKKELIALTNSPLYYDNKITTLDNALEDYFLGIIKNLSGEVYKRKDIDFIE